MLGHIFFANLLCMFKFFHVSSFVVVFVPLTREFLVSLLYNSNERENLTLWALTGVSYSMALGVRHENSLNSRQDDNVNVCL